MSQPNETLVVADAEAGERLDRILALRFPQQSRSYFQWLIGEGLVLLNGKPTKKRIQPQVGDEIEVEFALTPEASLEPENIPLDILYEDEYLLAVNKPAGLVVHPGIKNWSGTFVNALLYHCQQLPEDALRPGIVHRLDKDTSGILLAAKTEAAHKGLVQLFAERKVHKEYVAICVGKPGDVTIDAPIGRHPTDRLRMTVPLEGGKSAKTQVKTEGFDGKLAVVRCFPESGRTHQIRVHLQHHRNPILGDPVYGNTSWNQKYDATRQFLHAHRIRFVHPITGEEVTLEAPLPDDMQPLIDRICS
jgi:23S rRNA pseudouridine1911/1915/1917 synthase